MPQFTHTTGVSEGDPARPTPRSTRYGLRLFVIYLVLYGGFVLLQAFAPSLMERDVVAGINLAIAYGMGLIVAALALALLYVWLCRTSPSATDKEESL